MKLEWVISTRPLWGREASDSLSELYHENSKLYPLLAQQYSAEFIASPFELHVASRGFRQYQYAPRVELPPILRAEETLGDVMHRRRSRRDLSSAITLAELSTLLRQALGPTAVFQNPDIQVAQPLRAWPSAGGLYPIDTYVVASRVNDLEKGLYHFNVMRCELERLPSRSTEALLDEGFFHQEFVTEAAVALILVGVFERTKTKYGERGYRLVFLDAGHASQNVLLTAEQHQISAVPLASFSDDCLAADLGLDSITEAVVHAIALGKPSGGPTNG